MNDSISYYEAQDIARPIAEDAARDAVREAGREAERQLDWEKQDRRAADDMLMEDIRILGERVAEFERKVGGV